MEGVCWNPCLQGKSTAERSEPLGTTLAMESPGPWKVGGVPGGLTSVWMRLFL